MIDLVVALCIYCHQVYTYIIDLWFGRWVRPDEWLLFDLSCTSVHNVVIGPKFPFVHYDEFQYRVHNFHNVHNRCTLHPTWNTYFLLYAEQDFLRLKRIQANHDTINILTATDFQDKLSGFRSRDYRNVPTTYRQSLYTDDDAAIDLMAAVLLTADLTEVDVTDIIRKLAGPQCNFYGYQDMTVRDILMVASWYKCESVDLQTSRLGLVYEKDGSIHEWCGEWNDVVSSIF